MPRPATRCASRASAFFISTERTLCANVRVHSVSLMLSVVGRKCTSMSVLDSPPSESCQHNGAKRSVQVTTQTALRSDASPATTRTLATHAPRAAT